MVKGYKSKTSGGLAACHHLWNGWLVPMFSCLCTCVSDLWKCRQCTRNKISETSLCNCWTTLFVKQVFKLDIVHPMHMGLDVWWCAPCMGTHGVRHGQKLQVQDKWWVGCMSPALKNDWLVHVFWWPCISVSDQSPSTKWCNKQNCRNQVVQFLTNPSKTNFKTGHSLPLHPIGKLMCT